MSEHSEIEWTDATWNPVTGCTKISTGCHHCYNTEYSKPLDALKREGAIRGFEKCRGNEAIDLLR